MNNTSVSCYRPTALTFPLLNGTQMVVLTMANLVLMVVNIITNMLVIYILLKARQTENSACKLFLC